MHDLDPKVLFADFLDCAAPPLPTRADVLTGARRQLRRRRMATAAGVAGCVAFAVLGAGVINSGISPLGSAEFAGPPGSRPAAPLPPASWTVPDSQVACAYERRVNSDLRVVRWAPDKTPVEMCREEMSLLFRIKHRTLYACVYRLENDEGGAVTVTPGEGYATAAEACQSVHMYVAPEGIAPNPNPGQDRNPAGGTDEPTATPSTGGTK